MMKLQVYMTDDCPKCMAFGKNLQEALKELNLDEKIERIDLKHAIEMNITSCPALIINGEIKSMGALLSVKELKKMLKEDM
ncbi:MULTISPECIES: thioredoxin family protein [Methanobacterium]|jgi:predicted DsbA family dithiol-disulfide isomerase|uniref:Thioredoxin family protein n=2 Tax=Methanobacterium veterum TaxID=408577 RepID=A0A9E5DPZ9_9EURY|nr:MULTISPECIES: thioredoxin family protein [Methanobacterium]MCZ3372943.1 thioredoxin family protein [Methanobacterium veterum]